MAIRSTVLLASLSTVIIASWIGQRRAVAQSGLLAEKISESQRREADDLLAGVWADSALTAPRVAVLVNFETSGIGDDRLVEYRGSQVILIDDTPKKTKWRAVHWGRKNGDKFDSAAFYDGQVLWERAEDTEGWGLIPTWEKTDFEKINVEYFDPRSVWLCGPVEMSFSLQKAGRIEQVLMGRNCVAARREESTFESLWAKQECKGLNRITQLNFRESQPMPVTCQLYPSIEGDFSRSKFLDAQESSEFSQLSDLAWQKHKNGTWTLKTVVTRSRTNKYKYQISMDMKWLIGDEIEERFFRDPRKPEVPSLRELQFEN